MENFKDLMNGLEKAAGKFYHRIDEIPKDDPRFGEAWEYKCKLQTVIGEWYKLLNKWSKDGGLPDWLTILGDLN